MKLYKIYGFIILYQLVTAFICENTSYAQNAEWRQCAGLDRSAVYSFALSDSVIYAGTNNGVYRSTDGGNGWLQCDNGMAGTDVRSLQAKGDTIFAGTNNGVYRSTNGGAAWEAENNHLYRKDVRSLLIHGKTLFAGTDNSVYRSDDNTERWYGFTYDLLNKCVRAISASGDYIYAKISSSKAPTIKTPCDVVRLYDNGPEWEKTNYAVKYGAVSDTGVYDANAIAAADSIIIVGTDSGVHRSSDNGNSWGEQNAGLSSLVVRAVVVDGATVYAGTAAGVCRSALGGGAWSLLGSGLSGPVNALIIHNNTIFAGTTGNGVYELRLK